MKKIFIETGYPGFANNYMFNPTSDKNNSFATFIKLKRKMSELGYELTTVDDNSLDNCEGVIFMNSLSLYRPLSLKIKLKNSIKKTLGMATVKPYPTRKLYDEAIEAGMRDKLLLVLWEARATFPENYSPKLWAKFDRILTTNQDLIDLDPKKFKRFYIPMEENEPLKEVVPFNRKKLLVTIAHNKYYSAYKHELFKERRKLNAYFEKHYQNDFDLYGFRWNKPVTRLQLMFPFLVKKYSTYRGFAEDKIGTLSRYKFNMCYENISDAKGYIADKIFSAFQARSVPIYWGAPDVERFVDPDTFIDRRKFKNLPELAKFLTNMTEEEYNKYLAAADRFIKSQKYAMFGSENYCQTIISALDLKPAK